MGANYPQFFNHYMTDIELYREIGGWMRTFHNRNFFYSRLINDFIHDCYLRLKEKKEVNREYIKITCKYLPWELMRNKYAKRMKSHSEYVPLNNDGQPYLEFADNSFNPEYEFPAPPKPKLYNRKDTRRVKVLYRNGEEEEFDSIKELGQALNFKTYRTLYRYIGNPLTGKRTKGKMSHINVINYAD